MSHVQKTWRLLISLLMAMVFLVVGTTAPAGAAEIQGAITDINVTTTSTDAFGSVDFDLDWTVPNGSSGGDFFTLTLPPELSVPNSFTFDLTDGSGNVVAVATVNNGVVTFTLTSFVDGKSNISGTAFMEADVVSTEVEQGTTEDLVFGAGTETFEDTVDITVTQLPEGPRKSVRLLAAPTANGNDAIGFIESGLLTSADVGTTVTFVDTPAPGLELDCSTTAGTLRDFQPGFPQSGLVPASDYTETCTPASSTVTFVVTPAMVDQVVRFTWEMKITNPNLAEYTNNAEIDIGGEVTSESNSAQSLTGGGTGTGEVYDLALMKQLADGTNTAVVAPGGTVTFTLTVFNQLDTDAANVALTDYIPAGLTLADGNWTDNNDGTATLNTPIPALAGNASTTVDISFTVDAGASGTIDNFAEISAFTDAEGYPVPDIDSTPDANPGDTGPATGGDPDDDNVDGDSTAGEDEDDHDVASLTIGALEYDLALMKQLADGTNLGTVAPGDTVTFTLTVFNQLDTDAANVALTDYIPAGLTLADGNWTDNGDGTATLNTPIAALAGNASTTVDISFTVDAGASGTIDNFAEISAFTDAEGNDVDDIDSTPDATNDDVGPATGGDPDDDNVDGDSTAGEDEDDHDVASLTVGPVFDLALMKQLADGTNLAAVAPGSPVTFTLTVFNQGEVDGANIELVDYIPAGLTLADANWTDNGDGTATHATGIAALAAGESTTVDIMFTVDANATGTIDNIAEIAGATDADGNPVEDIDSMPDATNDDVGPATGGDPDDDNVEGNGKAGEDEDDHDVASLTIPDPDAPVFDLALRKQLSDGSNLGTFAVGDDVTFVITVFNQGEVAAQNIEIVDYLPAGLTLNDPDWNENSDGAASVIYSGLLAPGEQIAVEITFIIGADATGVIDNFAEIAAAYTEEGVLGVDIDSLADATGGDTLNDDDIEGDGLGGGDEDDHDIASIQIGSTLAKTGTSLTTVLLLVGFASLLIAGLIFAAKARQREQLAD